MNSHIDIVIDTGGKTPAQIEEVGDIGDEYDPIFVLLEFDAAEYKPLKCEEWLPIVRRAISKIERGRIPKDEKNDTVHNLLINLRDACERHPKAKVDWIVS